MNRLTYKFQSNLHIPWLLTSIAGISVVGWLTHATAPTNTPIIALFFLVFCLSLYGLFFNITGSLRLSLLSCITISVYLLLRLLGLRDLYYVLLLIGCIISLELYFQKQ